MLTTKTRTTIAAPGMRRNLSRTLATLAVMAAGAAALGATAGPASADDPNVTYSQGGTTSSLSLGCKTQYKSGVTGQYGAWGNFIDGCTVTVTCPSIEGQDGIAIRGQQGIIAVQRCDLRGHSFIDNYYHWGERVTMSARTRRFERGGHLYGWKDGSCEGLNFCEVNDSAVLSPGQSASVQCNGVRARPAGNWAQDYCSVELTERGPVDTKSQQGRGECTDWALYMRPDLEGVVSGNAKYWTWEARNAGRTVSKTPSAGALMVLQGGVMGAFAETGHVAYVVAATPTTFRVSQQNVNGIRTPTSETIQVSSLPPSGVDFIG